MAPLADATTVTELLARGAIDATAIAAPDRAPLDFGGLNRLVDNTVAALNAAGIGRNDRVGIVLPNGPEMATAFIAVAAGATAAPLNPAYRADEFEFYLSDLGAKALILQVGDDTPARAAADKLGIPVVPLTPLMDEPAGTFELAIDGGSPASNGGKAQDSDVALVLHTSGTTSRPKIVPLSHRNVCASARNISGWLELEPKDHCLNIMPLFHIHGLIAAVLSSLYGGASVSCTPGFNALRFFKWMDAEKPTWYTAVPTLEKTFNAPIIESYGMTEAAHQMASNPLPPRDQKPGYVGIAAGPEVGIMSLDGNILKAGDLGEIVIRGENVTDGYENNPDANAGAFTNGWFRTGDQGIIDDEGYLRLTGRLKEIINRGGEKVSPREVDDVLMQHPAVAQAVAFAVKHDKLGEDVAAAIVLREGEELTDKELREFAAKQLADFKVPRKVLFLEEIPKGATGKLQRIGLAEKLGLE